MIRRVAGPVALFLSAGFLSAPTAAHADAVMDLYVNNASSAHCSNTDANAGSSAVPFCTIQAAADVAAAGQTVHIAAGSYPEQVTLSRSGTATAPIKFVGVTGGPALFNSSVKVGDVSGNSVSYGLEITGARYVSVSGVSVWSGTMGTALVTGSSNVELQRASFLGAVASAPVVEIDGTSSAVEMDNSYVRTSSRTVPAIRVDAGAIGTVLAQNIVEPGADTGLEVNGAAQTAVTANTVVGFCSTSCVAVDGGATGTRLENNIVRRASQTAPAVLVDAASAPGTTLDYNIVFAPGVGIDYQWAGSAYTSAAALAAATGQGSHDLTTDPKLGSNYLPAEGSAAIDSADANAVGELATDYYGTVRADDPSTVNTGTGGGYYDRGAVELADPIAVGLSASSSWASGSVTETLTTAFTTAPWSTQATYVYDFGDGVTQTSNSPSITHTYSAIGAYRPSVTVTDAAHGTASATSSVTVADGNAYYPLTSTRVLDTRTGVGTGGVKAKLAAMGTLKLTLAGVGSFPSNAAAAVLNVTVTNPGDGGYLTVYPSGTSLPKVSNLDFRAGQTLANLVTVKVGTDGAVLLRNTSSAPTDVIADLDGYYGPGAGSSFEGIFPERAASAIVQAGTSVPMNVNVQAMGSGFASQVTAVALNVTVTQTAGSGYLTVYPAGAARPLASSIDYAAGVSVPNMAIVPVGPDGTINVYAYGAANTSVKVLLDVAGFYSTSTQGSGFIPVTPTRLIDTRNGTGTGTPGKVENILQIADAQLTAMPPAATELVSNVTVTNPTATSYMTVFPGYSVITQTSNLDFNAGQTVQNMVMVPTWANSSEPYLDFAMNGYVQADVIVDMFGYFD